MKSNHCARPILFSPPFLLWKHCLNCSPPPLQPNMHEHTHTLPPCPSHCEMKPFYLNPNQSQWDQWVVQQQNMAICPAPIPTAPWLIRKPLRVTHWANWLCLQATLCLIIWFICAEEELGEGPVCEHNWLRLFVLVGFEGWRQHCNICGWLE